MEDNRFLKVYQEYKNELKEVANNKIRNSLNNRFECLREKHCKNYDNRFTCLVDEDYGKREKEPEYSRHTPYKKPEPKESINTLMKKYREENRDKCKDMQINNQRQNQINCQKNTNNFLLSENNFPELSKSKIIQPVKKDMIVNLEIIPNNKPILTQMIIQNNKIITRDIYEDESEIIPANIVKIKKHIYNSWASVLKNTESDIAYYDKDTKQIIDIQDLKKLK
jgi:hypothetical protein